MKLLRNNSVVVLVYMIIKSNRISPKKFYIFLILFTRAIFTLPFILLQSILYKKKIRNTTLDKPPIFILGHYRSGTTLLHKLLTTDKKFGYISNYDILFSNSSVLLGKRMAFILQKFIQKFNIKNPHFNNSIHYLNDPGEEDMFLISRGSLFSDYWRFLFPLSWDKLIKSNLEKDNRAKQWNNNYNNLLKQFTFQNKGKQLLLKNPPNTGRVIKLLKMFPNAKFIYIHRNPYRLFYSMRNLWNNVIIKYYTLEKLSKNKIDEIIYHDYKKLIVQYENDKKYIPIPNLIEIEYDQLESNPFEQIKRIYSELKIGNFKMVENALLKRIDIERNYKKFKYDYVTGVFDETEKRWRSIIKNRKYTKPEIISSDV